MASPKTLRALGWMFATWAISAQFAPHSFAETPYIAVGQAKTKKAVVGLPSPKSAPADGALAKTLIDTVRKDLVFIEAFSVMDPKGYLEDNFDSWKSIGVEILIKSELVVEGSKAELRGNVYDVDKAKEIFSERYVGSTSEGKILGHRFANDIVQKLTGWPGIFLTRITMSCDRNSQKKEIYTINIDGTDARQITQHRSVAFSPSWSPDANRVVYSVIAKNRKNVKNIDLYEFDFVSSTMRLLSNRTGINSGARYSPDGKTIALTMSFLGNPEIFILDPESKEVTRKTKTVGLDVDPMFSPDGKQIVFSSTRSGQPMIWVMNADGSNPRKITIAGKYNAAPAWSPRGDKIAFQSVIDADRVVDLFLMDPNGANLEKITKNQRKNEDPDWSPDGNFITFTSNRTGSFHVYITNRDGSSVRNITAGLGLGNCHGPKWSPK